MDEWRKHAILFAATLLCARKLLPAMEADRVDASTELLTERFRWACISSNALCIEPVTPAYVFFATSTPVRLLLENFLIHNLCTLFCVWRGFFCVAAQVPLCVTDWGMSAGDNTKEICALV